MSKRTHTDASPAPDTRQHILLVSLTLFLQKNFKEVTMKEIVTATGMSKGAVYHHFDSKESLFREIIGHFFSAILSFDFTRLPGDSLRSFYRAIATDLNAMRFQFLSGTGTQTDFITLNFFSLLFDAFKLFPEFRTDMETYHLRELEAWTGIIAKARAAGEIRTPLDDKQVARIFLYASDGLTMNLTMDSNTGDLESELLSLWDHFYETLKA
ncbi:MAG: TetR/AcrR family transcriptional regulator [Bacteroidales bacterium]